MRYGKLMTVDACVKARNTSHASLIKPGGYKTMNALYLQRASVSVVLAKQSPIKRTLLT